MTTPVTPTATLPTGYHPPVTAVSASAASTTGVNADTFLQLLVAQLKYQNPSSPTDSTAFLTQTAAFQEVQQLTSLQSSVQQLISQQQTSAATGLLGRQATALGSDGATRIDGIVSSIQMGSAGPELTIAGQQVPLSSVLALTAPTNPATGGSTG